MKKFLMRIFFLAIILFISDYVGGYFLRKILFYSPDGRYFKTIYTLDQSNEEIIIYGSSRAEANYVPTVFEGVLGKKTWNAGRGGQGLPFWFGLFLGMKERHIPKIAIINVEPNFLRNEDNTKTFERAGFLRPFYKSHKPLQKIIDRVSYAESYLIKSDFYAFNSSYYYLLRPFFFKGVDGKIEDRGWKPLYGKMKVDKLETRIIDLENDELNQEMKLMFSEFVGELNNKGCRVFVCVSPDFGRKVTGTPTLVYLQSLKEINLIDFSASEDFIIFPSLYKDRDHLNIEGARKFSETIAKEIKTVLNK
jgi:hypothetical protein